MDFRRSGDTTGSCAKVHIGSFGFIRKRVFGEIPALSQSVDFKTQNLQQESA
jgi:hypothetical protein